MKLGLLVPARASAGAGAAIPSGGDLYDEQLARALRRRGHHVDVIGTPVNCDARALARSLHQAGYAALLQDELGHAPYAALNRVLRGSLPAFALVHVTTAQLDPAARTAAAERQFLSSARGAVFVSRHVRRETNRLLGLRLRGLVLPPGADHLPAAPAAHRGARAKELRRAQGVLRCLCVAHLLPHKGQLELIDVFARSPPGACLFLAGDETRDRAYARRVRRAAAQLGRGRVQLLGALRGAALSRVYANAHVCVSASYYESYGIAIAEAVAHGLPVVTWTRGGLWEFLESDVNALRIRPGDSQAFASAIASLSSAPGQLARLRRGARAGARRLPSWDMAAARLESWLSRALSGSLARASREP